MKNTLTFLALMACPLSPLSAADAPAWPVPQSAADSSSFGRNLTRSMALISGSEPRQRNTVRVLFYGQSITAQWSSSMEQYLRRTYPYTNFVFAHRAIGGFSATYLVRTAPTDINTFYPDLMLFHDYTEGPEPYEQIIRQTLENTTADILIVTDHITKPRELDDPATFKDNADQTRVEQHNTEFLPSLAKRYDVELADIRPQWKDYLLQNKLAPQDLLKDVVHLNDHGTFVMCRLIEQHLKYNPAPGTPPDKRVATRLVGADLHWTGNTLELQFTGNRIDLIANEGPAAKSGIQVRIDGVPPSALPSTTVFNRTSQYPKTWWPALLRVSSQTPLVPEDWSLRLFDASDDLKEFKFEVTGSVTGNDGTGDSRERFVSKSGRVVIEPQDWSKLARARSMTEIPLPEDFRITWKSIPQYKDEFLAPAVHNSVIESATTVVQGIPNGPHRLTLIAADEAAAKTLKAVRIYTPRLNP